MMSDNIEYVYPIGYGIKKIQHELIYGEKEEYESGDCYSGDEEEDDDDYLFQNSSALKDLPILIQLKAYYTKLSAGLHGRYTNSYVYDPTTPQKFGQKLKLWVEDTDGNFIELYFINETSDINTNDKPWRGYDYSNDHTLQKYTQQKNILNIRQKLDLNWTELKDVNVKLRITNIRDLLSRIKRHYEIRNKLKIEARNSHIKLDMQKLKKDKLYRVLSFPYIDNVTKQKKTVDYQIIKIWTTDENGYSVKMYYVMAGTNDKLYGRWIGVKAKDQTLEKDPIDENDLTIITPRLIEGFDALKIKDHQIIPEEILKNWQLEHAVDVSYINSGINNLLKKIAEHYWIMTHPSVDVVDDE